MCKKLRQMSLLLTQDSSILEVCKVLVTIVDNDLVGRALQEVMPLLKRIDISRNLFVMDFVIHFYSLEFSIRNNDWMQLIDHQSMTRQF